MAADEDIDILTTFLLPEDGPNGPASIAAKLVKEEDRFTELREGDALVLFLMRAESRYVQDQLELGSMHLPVWQGRLGPVARWLLAKVCNGLPDFLMILDQQYWEQATLQQKTALVYHEMLHAGVETDRDGLAKFSEDGRPKWAIRPHDLEAFDAEAEKFGAWRPEIARFVKSYGKHTGDA